MIRINIPSLEEADFDAVREVLTTGFLVQGPNVAAFEQAVAEYVGVEHAVAVSSGTAALHLALLAAGVERDDIVVTTAYSWPATANVIELCGARPVFVDIDRATYNIDPDCLDTVLADLTRNPGTARRLKAILPVHAFGQLADMPAILEAAHRYNVPVIEDAACALGARLQSRAAGTWGAMGCFSFHPRKMITTGEGGLITTDDPSLANCLRALRNHGMDPEASRPDFILPGFNYRMTDFQAALGVVQLGKLDRKIARHGELVQRYAGLFEGTPVTPPSTSADSEPSYQSYVAMLPADAAPRRADLIAQLRADGVETTIGTVHIPLTTFFSRKYRIKPGDFPVTDAVAAQSLTLPLHEQLSEEDQQTIVGAVLAEAEQKMRKAS